MGPIAPLSPHGVIVSQSSSSGHLRRPFVIRSRHVPSGPAARRAEALAGAAGRAKPPMLAGAGRALAASWAGGAGQTQTAPKRV